MVQNVGSNPFGDPNVYAQNYADQNGITLEEAKAELKAKFGDPKKDGANAPKENMFKEHATNENEAVEIGDLEDDFDDSSMGMNKDAVIQALMDKADISYSEAKDALAEIDPSKGNIDPSSAARTLSEATGLSFSEAQEFLQSNMGEPREEE